MQLQTIQLKVGRKTQLLNSSGAFIDGLITAADVTSFINDRGREWFLKIQNIFPWRNSYTEYPNTVAAQTFYKFSGFTKDVVTINAMGIKYSSTDTDYTMLTKKPFKSIFQTSTSEDVTSETSPYYVEDKDTTGALGVNIYPTPSTSVTNGLMVKYTYMPVDLSISSDEFEELPELLMETLIEYVVADVWEAKRDWANSNQALNRAILLESKFFENYDPQSSDTPARFYPNKTFNPFKGR